MAIPSGITPDDVKRHLTAKREKTSTLPILLTAKQLSAATQIAESTIYEWAHLGYIPHVRLSRCLRFNLAEVQTWLNRHARPGRTRRVPEVEV